MMHRRANKCLNPPKGVKGKENNISGCLYQNYNPAEVSVSDIWLLVA